MSDRTGHLWVEEGDRREGRVAEVAPLIPTSRTYTYAVPPELEHALKIGQRVTVPIGRGKRSVQGYVVSLDRGPWDTTLPSIDAASEPDTFLTPDLVALGREIALHYVCPLGRTLTALTPQAVRRQRGLKTVRYARLVRPVEDLLSEGRRVSAKRRQLLERLAAAPSAMRVDHLMAPRGASPAILRALVKEGSVEITSRREPVSAAKSHDRLAEPSFELNEEQQAAIDRIHRALDAKRFSVTLLFGVSGSGKTEVYIRAIRRVVAAGQQAILLVPEILLTAQLWPRLAQRFADVAVSHSGLTETQRADIWRQIAAGEKKVVIGTRSAVFAPCSALGLICVDEEQETSYKNLRAPRFHVRDVAIMRARQWNIPVVLGTATPSISAWYYSEHHPDYQRVVLRKRVEDRPLPRVHQVDMREEWMEQKRHVVLSRSMERLLGETLARGEQALLLVNRRGFANRIYCPACRGRLSCPNCQVNLVVHRAAGQSICHYCRCRIPTPTHCPNVTCGARLLQTGVGTERVSDVVAARFPEARIARVDSDTMKHRDQYGQIVRAFEARAIDVLVGTQMIAKGLDFPFISFVGVVHADPAALAADFRAHERLFQLITQTAGRAGRADAAGQVVVQTTTPELPAVACALKHDYESFAAGELRARQRVGLPPFRRLARIILAHRRGEVAQGEAEALGERIRATIDAMALEHADVWGPNPCVLSRLRGRYRFDLLLRTGGAETMRRLMKQLESSNNLKTKAESTIVDVDPVSLA